MLKSLSETIDAFQPRPVERNAAVFLARGVLHSGGRGPKLLHTEGG